MSILVFCLKRFMLSLGSFFAFFCVPFPKTCYGANLPPNPVVLSLSLCTLIALERVQRPQPLASFTVATVESEKKRKEKNDARKSLPPFSFPVPSSTECAHNVHDRFTSFVFCAKFVKPCTILQALPEYPPAKANATASPPQTKRKEWIDFSLFWSKHARPALME